ncbi:MAG: hypothetical protein AAFN92_20520, partial [Bacteroidota bacterium]
IWESVEEYQSADEARCAFDCFCALVPDRRNYQRRQLADCNLFGLELTRPDRVLAEHPRRYAGPQGLTAAKEAVLNRINGEGLRLVEHILLRPRLIGDATIPNVCPAPAPAPVPPAEGCTNRDGWYPAVEIAAPVAVETYVPGADPYSHWITVLLPSWPFRFQNANFREFFEASLRRETPAHLALKICWLDPKQMRDFEARHRRWLATLGTPDNCARATAQDRLIAFLDQMTTVYPPSRLQGSCDRQSVTDAGAVLLGQTQLS